MEHNPHIFIAYTQQLTSKQTYFLLKVTCIALTFLSGKEYCMWGFPLLHLVKPSSLGDSNMVPLFHLGATGKERGPTKEYSGKKVYSLMVLVYI